LRAASGERITSVSNRASANGIVVLDCALRSNAAGVGARICALLLRASLVQWALRADNALRSTARWRTNVGWQARANCLFVHNSALAVRAAR
jgi:hypothetical protein